MKKYILGALTVSTLVVLPEVASATSAFSGSSMQEIITGFFGIPLVKGVIMAGSIGGGLYLVLKGFGIMGDSVDPKRIFLGAILTGIGLSYNSITTKIADQFTP